MLPAPRESLLLLHEWPQSSGAWTRSDRPGIPTFGPVKISVSTTGGSFKISSWIMCRLWDLDVQKPRNIYLNLKAVSDSPVQFVLDHSKRHPMLSLVQEWLHACNHILMCQCLTGLGSSYSPPLNLPLCSRVGYKSYLLRRGKLNSFDIFCNGCQMKAIFLTSIKRMFLFTTIF